MKISNLITHKPALPKTGLGVPVSHGVDRVIASHVWRILCFSCAGALPKGVWLTSGKQLKANPPEVLQVKSGDRCHKPLQAL